MISDPFKPFDDDENNQTSGKKLKKRFKIQEKLKQSRKGKTQKVSIKF